LTDEIVLNPCRGGVFRDSGLFLECGEPAVEQTRGSMGAGDYKEMQKIDRKGHWRDDPDFYKIVHLDEYNRPDFRISCSVCDNATPWNQADAPGMPGVGKDFARKMWNERNPVKV